MLAPKILAIDTAFSACSVALQIGENIVSRFLATDRRHNELILPMISEVLLEANITLKDLSAVAFGCGPGSFTGVRIAASVVQGLSFATQLPVICVSSLQAVAQGVHRKTSAKQILVGIDARMQAIYFAGFTENEGLMQNTLPEEQINISDFKVSEGDWLVSGDAWEAYPLLAQAASWQWAKNWQPSAEDLLPQALRNYQKHEFGPAQTALPIYFTDSHWRKLPGR